MEIPGPRLAASRGDDVLALVDPGVQVVQPLDVRLDRPPFLAVGPSRPVRDGAELLLRVTGQLGPRPADLQDLAPFGMDQDRERCVKDGPAELLLALAQLLFHPAATGDVQKSADAATDAARRVPERADVAEKLASATVAAHHVELVIADLDAGAGHLHRQLVGLHFLAVSVDPVGVRPLVRRGLGEGGIEGQLGHAEDSVHGGADLVADVGQELILGAVGRLRCLLGLLKGFGRPLLVVDVGVGPEPHQHPAFGIAHGQGAAEVPAVNAVRTAEAVLQLKRLAGVDGVLPTPDVLFHVLGVDELRPPPAFNLVEGKPGELGPLLVEIIHVPVGVGGEDFLRDGLGQETVALLAAAGLRFALPQRLFGPLLLGDHLAKDEDAADLTLLVPPRTDLPAQPVHTPVRPLEAVLLAALHRSGQAAAMHFLPPLRDVGEDLVVAAPDDVPVLQPEIGQPPLADEQVAHVPVEHGDRCGGVFHEEAQPLLALAQRFLGPFALGHVANEGGEQVLLAQADRGDADFGGELAAVAAQGRDFDDAVEQPPLAGRQEASQAAAVIVAEQDAADRLGPRPAEGDLGLAVPFGDEAVGTHRDEGVVGIVQDEAPALLALPQRFALLVQRHQGLRHLVSR